MSDLDRSPLRKELHGLRSAWRQWASDRCQKCGHVRIQKTVPIHRRGESTHFHGLVRCGSAWECAYCHAVLQLARADEVQAVVDHHRATIGQQGLTFITLTIRHGFGDDLDRLRRGVANAWRATIRGQPWRRWERRLGARGFTRRLELTYGPHGWHPHLHAIMYTTEAVPPAFREWLSDRWANAVERILGVEHRPTEERGVRVSPLHDTMYLTKLGLELTAPGTKDSAPGHYSPLELLREHRTTKDNRWAHLYREYARAMKGAKMLTWSRGLKAAAGVTDRTDQEIIDGENEAETVVCILTGEAWDRLRELPAVPLALLQVAESGGAAAVDRLARSLLTDWPPGAPVLEAETDRAWWEAYRFGWPYPAAT